MTLTLILLTWRIWWAPNNASRWQMGFNLTFKELITVILRDNCMLFFWVIPQRLNFICRRFETLCLFHLHRQVGMKDEWGWECWGIHTGKGLARKLPEPIGRGEPPLPCHPPSYWLRLFSSQTFSLYEYPNILNPIHPLYLSAYEDGTDRVFRNVDI